MRTTIIISVGLLLFLILPAGCGTKKPDKTQPSQQQAAKVETPKAESIKESPAKPEEGYTYNPRGRRDPFKSLIVAQKGKTKPDLDLPPLQRVDSADLRLTGIIWDKSDYIAILETPDGKGFVVKEGTMVGLNKGVVKKITNRSLVVEEKIKTYLGDLKTREVPLELHKREEGL